MTAYAIQFAYKIRRLQKGPIKSHLMPICRHWIASTGVGMTEAYHRNQIDFRACFQPYFRSRRPDRSRIRAFSAKTRLGAARPGIRLYRVA
jgi:hypothetical protein